MNHPNSANSGVQPRLSQRRKESQKPGELTRTRGGKEGERKNAKRKPEPYGRDERMPQRWSMTIR